MPVEIRELHIKATVPTAPTVQDLERRIAQLEQCIQLLGDKITLQAGGSSLTVSPMGVTISAREVTITSQGSVAVKASRDVVLKGSKIVQN